MLIHTEKVRLTKSFVYLHYFYFAISIHLFIHVQSRQSHASRRIIRIYKYTTCSLLHDAHHGEHVTSLQSLNTQALF